MILQPSSPVSLDPSALAPTGDAAAAAARLAPEIERGVQRIDSVVGDLQALPWGIHAVMGGLLLLGLALWLMGRAVLRPVAALIGAGVGAAAGFVALPVMFPTAGLSPYVGLIGGLVLGLLLALFLYKVATAGAFGVILATGAALVTAGVMNIAGSNPAPSPAGSGSLGSEAQKVLDRTLTPPALSGSTQPSTSPGVSPDAEKYPNLGPMTRSVRDFARGVRGRVGEYWSSLPEGQKPIVAVAALGGLVVGCLLGFVLPGWSGAIVTSLLGAAIWLWAAVWLMHAMNVPMHEKLSGVTPVGWAVVWLIVGMIGFGMQSAAAKRRAARAKAASTAGSVQE